VEGSAQRSCWRLPIQLRRGNSSPPHIIYSYLSIYLSDYHIDGNSEFVVENRKSLTLLAFEKYLGLCLH
jgi:hypothetical protein